MFRRRASDLNFFQWLPRQYSLPQPTHLKKRRCLRSTEGGTFPATSALPSVSSSPPHIEQRGAPLSSGTPFTSHALAIADTLAPSLLSVRWKASRPFEAARPASSRSEVSSILSSRPAASRRPVSSPAL